LRTQPSGSSAAWPGWRLRPDKSSLNRPDLFRLHAVVKTVHCRSLSHDTFMKRANVNILLLLLMTVATSTRAQNYDIDWFKLAGGSGTSAGGVYQVSGTLGQPDAGQMSGGDFSVSGGFWPGLTVPSNGQTPTLFIQWSGNSVMVSWSPASAGFQLEATVLERNPPQRDPLFPRLGRREKRERRETDLLERVLQVFGIRRRVVASFEEPVKKISGDYGYIDLFWPGILLVEHKSFGKDLGKAESQAFQYIRTWRAKAGATNPPLRHRLRFRPHRPARPGAGGTAATCRCLLNRAGPPIEFPLADFTSTSTPSPSFPATSSTGFRSRTPSTSKPSKSWATCTTPWRRAATPATTSNASSSASSSASSPRTPAFSSANPSSCTVENRTAEDGSDWACTAGAAL
jgi:hypothetical protein